MPKKLVIEAKARDLGDDFSVRRSLPSRHQRMVGPFIFWDHMGPVTLSPEKAMLVRPHPHIGLSTITYLFSGQILHRDSLNNEVTIRPGEVNWMTAGCGIAHSERSHPESAMELEGIQLWVALPKESEDVEPSFVHQKEKDLPLIEYMGFQMRLVAGEAFGESSPLPVYSPLFYLNGKSQQSETMSFPVGSNQEAAVYIISGEIENEGETYGKFSMIVFEKGTPVEFQARGACEFMIFGGNTFPEERYIWWNFVSHNKNKIEQAKERWQKDDFGQVLNETVRTPLPDS